MQHFTTSNLRLWFLLNYLTPQIAFMITSHHERATLRLSQRSYHTMYMQSFEYVPFQFSA
jgi:hypothetical protein